MSRKKKPALATQFVERTGLKIVYEEGKCEVQGFRRLDGGYQWMFMREGRSYPLALSANGMAAMSQIYHQLASGYPPLPNKPKDAA